MGVSFTPPRRAFFDTRRFSEVTGTSQPADPALLYRPNVAAILQNGEGQILVGERLDVPDSWQFPQGGLDLHEDPEAALRRELLEEISLAPSNYVVLERRGPYRYLFPAGYTKKGFHGQEQHYFLLRLTVPQAVVNVATSGPEFGRVRWIEPSEFRLASLPPMKHEVYRQVFRDFFGLNIG